MGKKKNPYKVIEETYKRTGRDTRRQLSDMQELIPLVKGPHAKKALKRMLYALDNYSIYNM